MERHKWRSLHKIVNRTNHDAKAYLNCVKELEKKARACYEGIIALSSEEFVEMMVLDGCFILEFFRGVAEGFINLGYSQNDPVFNSYIAQQSYEKPVSNSRRGKRIVFGT
ncbi:hypothetical protein GIB67_001270 [Kingdonia uniflora]|uniref:Uncharacterized protein n=1 Tax=Kingdonia uniflora TaxID=39325 RepID=A0A7J7LHG4_9MAGN|nr:hypothetical protein GIB67_001270 [Kingdonia uniflora]